MSNRIVQNWIDLAEYDLGTAEAMLKTGRYLYVAFVCQQSVEKLLKAGYVKELDGTPPYTHNLVRLINDVSIFGEIDKDMLGLIETLNSYYIESRYTEEINELSQMLTAEKAKEIYEKTKELFLCLKSRI